MSDAPSTIGPYVISRELGRGGPVRKTRRLSESDTILKIVAQIARLALMCGIKVKIIGLSLMLLSACGAPSPVPSDNGGAQAPLTAYLGQIPPGRTPKIFADEVFSQFDHLHSCPVFSPNGTEVYWAVAARDCRSWFMTRSGDEWSRPQRALFLRNGMGDSPIISPDGNRIFFQSLEPTGIDKIRPESIWYVDRTVDGWSEPKPVAEEVNTYLTHWQVSVATNGNLYFAGSMTNPDQRDIVMARLVDGEYSQVMVLGDAINTTESESNPFIDPEERYLIFSRRRSSGFTDLFISFKRPNGLWTKARGMGRRINTGSHELCANVSRDGQYLFFLSPRSGQDKIYWVDASIIEELTPDELR